MLTIAQCKGALGPDHKLSDEDLLRLRDVLYALARIVTDSFPVAGAISSGSREFDQAMMLVSEPERDAVVERAAIQEFEGGFPRDIAERQAIAAVAVNQNKRRRRKTSATLPSEHPV
jgi:hypothetical protein